MAHGVSGGGTRFRLYPQLAQGYREPELVEIALPPGAIGPGPQDAAMYVAHPLDKTRPYAAPDLLPPWRGPRHPPALPGPDGHFDHIPPGTPQFLAAHLYGAARHVLDLWQGYLGHPVRWWHADVFPRLELVPSLRWGNAHAGFGFLETGLLWNRHGRPQEMCLNLDVVAHEIGHAILFSTLGAPAPGRLTGAYLAFHEAFSDLVAAISVLHFDSVVARMLRQTGGNLYALNLVSRLTELSDIEQVRVLDNEVRLADLEGLRLGPDGGWIDPLGLRRRQHAAAAPVAGAIWDCLIELFQDGLARRGAIAPALDTRGWTREAVAASIAPLGRATGEALARFETDFVASLRRARDLTGLALARCIGRLDPDDLDLATIAARFCEALGELGEAGNMAAFVENFTERGIDPRRGRATPPRRDAWGALPPGLRRAGATRRGPVGAGFGSACPGCHDPRLIASVGRLIQHPHREAAALVGG